MSRKAWLIVIGLALVWLSPLLIALVKTNCFPERQDQTANWIAWHKAERKRKHEESVAFWRQIRGYQPSYQSSSSRQEEREVEVVYVDRPVVTERVVYREPAYQSRQPDLSGIYYNIPLTGPNNGNVQFNYIGGPY